MEHLGPQSSGLLEECEDLVCQVTWGSMQEWYKTLGVVGGLSVSYLLNFFGGKILMD